jgi:argininosuccinate synthase
MTNTNQGSAPILLAFSGGLDTSFCVPWLTENYHRPVVTVTVNTGGIDAEAARTLAERARALGAVEHHLVDARTLYFEQVIRFLIMGNVRRGNLYPLCVGAGGSCRHRPSRSGAADRHGRRRARLDRRWQRPGAVRGRVARSPELEIRPGARSRVRGEQLEYLQGRKLPVRHSRGVPANRGLWERRSAARRH